MNEDIEARYQKSLHKLNERQRAAVEYIDGPLLVVAGPGTGKTQLLSTRAAYILHERAVGPKNILCLTFTDAGSQAMSERLIRIIGQDAYDIEVFTFHAFAQHLSTRYPEFFTRSPTATLITDLHKNEVINDLLNGLSINAAGRSGKFEGVNVDLKAAIKFIDDFKKSGLSAEQYRAIVNQTLGFIELAEADPVIAEFARINFKGINDEEKRQIFDDFVAAVNRVYAQAPHELKEPVVRTPGIYTPYATYFTDLVRNVEVCDDDGKAKGVAPFRSAQFNKDAPGGHVFKDYKPAQRSLDIIDVYEQYRTILKEEDLYDYDDIINDAITAIEDNAELQTELAQRYEYIQVDEFQDTNGSQMRLLELTIGAANEQPNVMAVGDDDQAIMRFQGATIECIEQFKDKWHPEEVFLTTNYRSAPNIIELGQVVAEQIDDRLEGSREHKKIVAPEGRPNAQDGFTELIFPSTDTEYHSIVQKIQEILASPEYEKGVRSGSIDASAAIGVIAPKHTCLKELVPYLEAAGISYSYKEKLNVFNIESMQTLLAIMRFVTQLAGGHEQAALAYLPQIIAAPEIGLTHEEVVDFMIFARSEYGADWLKALQNAKNETIASLWEKLTAWVSRASADPIRKLIMEMAQYSLKYYGKLQEEDVWSLIELNAGIRELLRFVTQEVANTVTERALRLPDIVEYMDKLPQFDISIDTEIEIGDASAVHLTSIHSSKGLEYEWVFLIDADDRTWHYDGSGNKYLTPNIYLSIEKDEDDHRRALFVAVTRAKDYLYICRNGGEQLRELNGQIRSEEAEITEDELAEIIQTDWRDGYALHEPRFAKRIVKDVEIDRLSVSRLNRFVTYHEDDRNFRSFLVNSLMRVPGEPYISTEFGTLMHAYMDAYIKNQIYGDDALSLEQMEEHILQKIALFDFPESDISDVTERFANIVEKFIPEFEPFKRAREGKTRLVTEVALDAVTKDGVPLYGRLDLLEVDDENKRIAIHDYKTGKHNKDQQLSYNRQLLFYKYLVEQSGEYDGYEVVDCVDYYIEQVGKEEKDNPSHFRLEVDDMPAALDHLERLVAAVWKRIKEGNYDDAGFEESPAMKDFNENYRRADGAFKSGGRKQLQRVYEDWLIENS